MQLDSVVGPGPDVTQCSDGSELRRYDWGGDTAVVVTPGGNRELDILKLTTIHDVTAQ